MSHLEITVTLGVAAAGTGSRHSTCAHVLTGTSGPAGLQGAVTRGEVGVAGEWSVRAPLVHALGAEVADSNQRLTNRRYNIYMYMTLTDSI